MAGAGLIPRHAVRDWCLDEGIDQQLTQLMFDVIRFLDGERAERIASEHAHRTGG